MRPSLRQMYILQAVQCNGCGLVANANPPQVLPSHRHVTEMAVAMHEHAKEQIKANTGQACPKEALIIIYANCLVQPHALTTVPPEPSRIVKPNGNGQALIKS